MAMRKKHTFDVNKTAPVGGGVEGKEDRDSGKMGGVRGFIMEISTKKTKKCQFGSRKPRSNGKKTRKGTILRSWPKARRVNLTMEGGELTMSSLE